MAGFVAYKVITVDEQKPVKVESLFDTINEKKFDDLIASYTAKTHVSPKKIETQIEKDSEYIKKQSCLMRNVFYEGPRYFPGMEQQKKYTDYAIRKLDLPAETPREELLEHSKRLLLDAIERERIKIINVTMNRVNSDKYSDKICKVIYQYKQFSWTLESVKTKVSLYKRYKHNQIELDNIEVIKELVDYQLVKGHKDLTDGAMWYHTPAVFPKWRKSYDKVVMTLWHIYYKEA